MEYGFIKVKAVCPDIRVGDCRYNAESIIAAARTAGAEGVRLLVLPELAVTGYTCGDLFLQRTLVRGAEEALLRIAAECAELDMLIAVGAPINAYGRLYNCAAVLHKGRVLGVVPKTQLSGREARWFTPANKKYHDEIPLGSERVTFDTEIEFTCSTMPELTLGVRIGAADMPSALPPAAVVAHLAAEIETAGAADSRRMLVAAQSRRASCGYVYSSAGCGESTADAVFGGHQLVAENGEILAESAPFDAGQAASEIDVFALAYERHRRELPAHQPRFSFSFGMEPRTAPLTRRICTEPFLPQQPQERERELERILTIQATGLRRRLEHTRSRTAVIGVSGGLDSTLALLVTAKAFDMMGRSRAEICAVSMPCFGTTQRTKSNAQRLCEELGVSFREIDITAAVRQHLKDIGHAEGELNAAYENAQARERTQVLMDLANDIGGLVVGTGDLSELALGWATYNGDHMSMYSVNGGVPKTLVRRLTEYCARTGGEALRAVLTDVLDTPVSPELLPAQDGNIAQKTEDLVGPYELHDFFIYHMLVRGTSPRKIYYLACAAFAGRYPAETVLKWLRVFLRRFFSQQFKRSCLPDGPQVLGVSLSPRGGWQMGSDLSSELWLAELEEL
ncbi:MAG: NAD(+) synthase [Clostridia bacterium]|nr:NAD(+) synthase [Clostridia bacterium]